MFNPGQVQQGRYDVGDMGQARMHLVACRMGSDPTDDQGGADAALAGVKLEAFEGRCRGAAPGWAWDHIGTRAP